MSAFTNHRLSLLQRTILGLGFSNRQRRKDQRPIDVTRAEVLSGYYGQLVTPGHANTVFSRYRVGPARYNSAQVSLANAMQRLRKRGLIRLDTDLRNLGYGYGLPSGTKLTSAGITAAKTLPEWKA